MIYRGLSTEEVSQRIENGLVNTRQKGMTDTTADIIRRHTLTYFNCVNTVLFVIVLLTGKQANSLFYMTVIINTVMGIWQEIKARRLLRKMEILNEEPVRVRRDGRWQNIPPEELVMDDLMSLSAGLEVPADGRIVAGTLELNESLMTGESNTVIKEEGAAIYAGTIITAGRAEAVVSRVGENSVAAIIMQEGKKFRRSRSQLASEIEKLLKIISVTIVPTGIVIFLTQWLRTGMTWQDSALSTVAAVVGMIPEGLVVLTSAALVVSTIRLSGRQVLVHDLYSIESLARIDTLCLDKTGTLTKGKMKVEEMHTLGGTDEETALKALRTLLKATEAHNATSSALMEAWGSESNEEVISFVPFSSERKYSAANTASGMTYLLGAPQVLLADSHPEVLEECVSLSKLGIRVVVLASSERGEPEGLTPLAFFTISDELRDNTREIMDYFSRQDVTLKVISGDDPAAVSAIARKAGIKGAENYIDLFGAEPDYDEIVEKYTVFGRVQPLQKKEIVEALKRHGHNVAMTGDGVNDVPALKSADVSVAMAAGAPAARDSASFVLMDSDFSRMPHIVDEGRRVINNITCASSMYLVKTGFSVLLSIYVIILAHSYPFVPLQLTLLSACGVGIPTTILQLEPSFSRFEGDFLRDAMRRALPSAFAVMCAVIACLVMKNIFSLTSHSYSGILMSITGAIYIYTLFKVYRPLTKLRAAVILCMAGLLAGAILLAGNLFGATLIGRDFFLAAAGIAAVPLVIDILSVLYAKTEALIPQQAEK